MADYTEFLKGSALNVSLLKKMGSPVDAKTIANNLDEVYAMNDDWKFEGLFVYVVSERKFFSFQGGITNDCFKPVGGSASSISFEEFDKTKVYTVGDYAIYNKNLYECITTTTIDTDFVDTEWKLLIGSIEDTFVKIKEVYNETNAYNTNDIVIYDKVVYQAKEDAITGTFDKTKWDLLIGDNGDYLKIYPWKANTDYAIGDYVLYNNSVYQSTSNQNTTDFERLSWVKVWGKFDEVWAENTQYNEGEYVLHQNKLYECIELHISTDTFDTSKFELVIGGGDGSSTITEDITVYGVCDQLGYKDGDTIPTGTDITTILKTLLQKVIHPTYVAPTLSVKTNKNLLELGAETTIVVTPTFTQNNGGAITGYKLYRDDVLLEEGTVLGSYTDTYTPTGTFNYKYEVSYDDGAILQNNTGADDEIGRILAGTIEKVSGNISVASPSYYGTVDALDEASICNATKVIRSKGDLTQKFTADNQAVFFAYPVSFGKLSSIINQNNYEVLSAFTEQTMTINTVDYYVYSLSNLYITDFGYTFKY